MLKVAFPSFKISKFCNGEFPQNPPQVSVSGACFLTVLDVDSHADSLRDSLRVPLPRASAETSWNLRKPITTEFQILEVHLDP